MPQPREPNIGGGANARPLNETLAGTGPGLPDEAVGRERRAAFEDGELDGPEAWRIEQKLRAEVLARRPVEDEERPEDPTGHA